MLQKYLSPLSAWLFSESQHSHFTNQKLPQLTPSEFKLKKLDNERSELVKLVKQERIISLKLSMINAILNLLQ